MLNAKKVWFRATSPLVAVLLVPFLHCGELSRAHAAERVAQQRLQDAVRHLGIDPRRVTGPVSHEASRKHEVESRREKALEELRRYTRADEQEVRAREAGEHARHIIESTPDVHFQRELARGRSLGLPEAVRQERLAKQSPELFKRLKETGAALGRTKKQQGTPDAPRFEPGRYERVKFNVSPPRREKSQSSLAPELEELYALAGEDAPAAQPDAPLLPPLDAPAAAHRPPLLLASMATDWWALSQPMLGVLPVPTSEDLAETPETERTQELKRLVTSLGGKPLALYNYVHQRIVPELYYGSKKGAAATLVEGRGNDFDQASLLIALLREAGIPARYEYARVRLSLAQAQALTGAPDAETAVFRLQCPR